MSREHDVSQIRARPVRVDSRPGRLAWSTSAPFREERKSPVVATVEQLAALVRGRLVGDGTVPIRSARPVAEAGPGDITFIENERYAKFLTDLAGLGRDRRAALQSAHARPEGRPARHRGRRPDRGVPRRPQASFGERQAPVDRGSSSGLGRADGADRRGRRDLSVRLRGRRGRDRRRDDPASRGGDRRSVPDRAKAARSTPTPSSMPTWSLGDRVEVHAGTRAGRRRFRLPPGGRQARQDPAHRPARGRQRRRDRGQLHDRPRHLRGDPDRRGDQDRQPRDDRPQQPDRPAQPALRPGGHRRELQDG